MHLRKFQKKTPTIQAVQVGTDSSLPDLIKHFKLQDAKIIPAGASAPHKKVRIGVYWSCYYYELDLGDYLMLMPNGTTVEWCRKKEFEEKYQELFEHVRSGAPLDSSERVYSVIHKFPQGIVAKDIKEILASEGHHLNVHALLTSLFNKGLVTRDKTTITVGTHDMLVYRYFPTKATVCEIGDFDESVVSFVYPGTS